MLYPNSLALFMPEITVFNGQTDIAGSDRRTLDRIDMARLTWRGKIDSLGMLIKNGDPDQDYVHFLGSETSFFL